MSGWRVTYPSNNEPGDVRVMPEDEKHEETPCCNCNPDAEQQRFGVLYLHHAYDGREGLEMAREILKQT